MTTYNPAQPSNLNTNAQNSTTEFFSNYYTPAYTVSSNTDDAILSWFEQVTGNKESAQLLAQTVINTAQKNREDPLKVLEQFKLLPANMLNSTLALYLNSSRVTTSLLGIVNTHLPNRHVARTVIW
jgi:hypothetical protein